MTINKKILIPRERYQRKQISPPSIELIIGSDKNNNKYIFDENWETLSQLTKMEVLSNELYKQRIIHDPLWESNLNNIMTF